MLSGQSCRRIESKRLASSERSRVFEFTSLVQSLAKAPFAIRYETMQLIVVLGLALSWGSWCILQGAEARKFFFVFFFRGRMIVTALIESVYRFFFERIRL